MSVQKKVLSMYKIISLKRIMLCIAGMAAAVICCKLIFSSMSHNTVQTASNTGNDGIELPILMYHGILKDTKLQGDYVISPSQFEQDLKMLKEKGFHTVTVSSLIDYVYSGKPIPEKPVMLTFDDGYYNNYLYAYPLLKKYKCSAVISPIAYYSEYYSNSGEKPSASYFHCTWQQLKEMQESGFAEIQNHSYNMHSQNGRQGIPRKKSEGVYEYRLTVKDDILKSQKMLYEKLGTYPQAFVYPFGEYNSISEELLKELSFKCTMICEERINVITKNPDSLYKLGRFLRSNRLTAEEMYTKITSPR